MNLTNYNIPSSTEVEINDYQPVPEGWYPVQIESEEPKETAKGGTMLVYKMSIFGDNYKGRKVFAQFNLVCPGSDTAETIGRKQLAQLGKACHLVNIVDSSELIGKTCKAHVIQDEYDGKIRNKVAGFDYLDNQTATPSFTEAPKLKAWYEK